MYREQGRTGNALEVTGVWIVAVIYRILCVNLGPRNSVWPEDRLGPMDSVARGPQPLSRGPYHYITVQLQLDHEALWFMW